MSIVLPAYNEEQMIEKTAGTIARLMENEDISYELVFVNDGSKDQTWERIKEASKKNSNIKGICFSRNFGKEGAVFAGLANASGDCVAVMDCDLQHPPETLITMYRLWEQGYQLPERNVFFRALSSWVGFKTTYVEFHVQEREAGESKWSMKSLFKYAINNITSFSAVPMQVVTFCGVIFFLFAIVLAVQSLYLYFSGRAVAGFTTVILLLLIIGSILMFSLGVIGYYLSKIYEEVKMRPRYIISEITETKNVN